MPSTSADQWYFFYFLSLHVYSQSTFRGYCSFPTVFLPYYNLIPYELTHVFLGFIQCCSIVNAPVHHGQCFYWHCGFSPLKRVIEIRHREKNDVMEIHCLAREARHHGSGRKWTIKMHLSWKASRLSLGTSYVFGVRMEYSWLWGLLIQRAVFRSAVSSPQEKTFPCSWGRNVEGCGKISKVCFRNTFLLHSHHLALSQPSIFSTTKATKQRASLLYFI